MHLQFVNVKFVPISSPYPFSDSSFSMNYSHIGNFPNSPYASTTAKIIDLDDSDDSENQSMVGFPTLSEIKRNPNLASELYDHITSLDEQLISLQHKTTQEITFYKNHIASLESKSAFTSQYIADIETHVSDKMANLEANLISAQNNLQAAYEEISRWKSMYFSLKESIVTIPVFTHSAGPSSSTSNPFPSRGNRRRGSPVYPPRDGFSSRFSLN
ncbi:hypothetical protein TorRG33x02_326120 [Trema orientale]|uniref:Uncharacterized protein n=1 Tax=Trema orientale TaxID=63057 RepID=A0A2P5BC46_TREOI|nr:hypothetical protein TorRG33x02_326120 [Trema orientale]